jgi:predicted ester cyclase
VHMAVQFCRSQHHRLRIQHGKIRAFWGVCVCLGLMLFSLVTPAMAGQLPSSKGTNTMQEASLTQTNKAIALRYAKEGWGNQPGWEKVWDELVAPNYVLHFNSFPEPIVGLEANKKFSEGLFQGFPDIKSTIEDVVAEGDKVIYRSTLKGTNTGEFLGTPATGKSVKVDDFTQLRFKNGKVVEAWYQTNLLAVMQQLGLAPAM